MGILRTDKKERFVKESLENILEKDSSYSHFFKDDKGERLPSETYDKRVSLLEESLEEAYDDKVKRKLRPGFSNYLATGLRGVAGVGYGLGTILFPSIGPAAFGLTGPGVGASYLADVIDSHYYDKNDLIEGFSKEDAKVTAESMGTKALGYLPIGTGLIDLYRGRRKFENAAISNLAENEDIARYAINKFADNLYKTDEEKTTQNLIPLSTLKDHRYTNDSKTAQDHELSTAA